MSKNHPMFSDIFNAFRKGFKGNKEKSPLLPDVKQITLGENDILILQFPSPKNQSHEHAMGAWFNKFRKSLPEHLRNRVFGLSDVTLTKISTREAKKRGIK